MDQNLKVMSKQERLENWAARITACRGSGMTVRAWCQENGFSEKTYYYWQRRLFQALSEQQQAAQQPAFVEITSTPKFGHPAALLSRFVLPELRRISIPARMQSPWKRCCGY